MKYEALKRRLEGDFSGHEARMGFAEIERVLGFALPASARKHQAWWSNSRHGHSHAAAWLDAGWRTSDLDLIGQRVTFRRDAEHGVAENGASFDHSGAATITFDVSTLSAAARKLVNEEARRLGVAPGQAVVALLNGVAIEKRRTLLDWFARASPPSKLDSVDLVREARDER